MSAYSTFRIAAIAFAGAFVGLCGVGSVAVAVCPTQISACGPIAQSGSYVVEKNLTAAGDCLVIRADFVTLDLGGFVLTGNGSGNGVTNNNVSHQGILIRNGTITNFENAFPCLVVEPSRTGLTECGLSATRPSGSSSPLVAHCHFGLARLYRHTGKREQGRERLTAATTMYREMDMQYWLEQAEAESSESA